MPSPVLKQHYLTTSLQSYKAHTVVVSILFIKEDFVITEAKTWALLKIFKYRKQKYNNKNIMFLP